MSARSQDAIGKEILQKHLLNLEESQFKRICLQSIDTLGSECITSRAGLKIKMNLEFIEFARPILNKEGLSLENLFYNQNDFNQWRADARSLKSASNVQLTRTKIQLIQELKPVIRSACTQYLRDNSRKWFTLLHRHGHSGRLRARNLLRFIDTQPTLEALESKICRHLSGFYGGNTHAHSLRTYLLRALNAHYRQALRGDDKAQLETIANNYGMYRSLLPPCFRPPIIMPTGLAAINQKPTLSAPM